MAAEGAELWLLTVTTHCSARPVPGAVVHEIWVPATVIVQLRAVKPTPPGPYVTAPRKGVDAKLEPVSTTGSPPSVEALTAPAPLKEVTTAEALLWAERPARSTTRAARHMATTSSYLE